MSNLVTIERNGRPAVTDAAALTLADARNWTQSVDAIAVEERAANLGKRSLKKATKVQGLKLAMSMIDLTTLEGKDTWGKAWALCQKARHPDPQDLTVPHCAAICVYPTMVTDVRKALAGSGVKTACVSTAFPSGQASLDIKLRETRQAVEWGAEEIDMVISRGRFLSGDYGYVFDEIAAVKDACGDAHLKVILETGDLGTYDQIRLASMIAMCAGADFIKTSTGKVTGRATPANTLVMLEAIRDFFHQTGRLVGMKPAGNIQVAKLALHYLVLVYETLGAAWMTPDLFRFGASTLANDVLLQLKKERTGAYQSTDYLSLD